MVVLKYKRISSTDAHFTQNAEYTSLSVGGDAVAFVDDSNQVHSQSLVSLQNPSQWELISIHTQQLVQVYP